jgi:hypothetical protein
VVEYPEYKFKDIADTNNSIKISSSEFYEIFKFLRQSTSTAKSVDINYFVICEDDVYKYSIPEYAGKLTTSKRKLTLIEECGDGVDDNKIPNDYSLNQNYPNPFNPETNIEYSLPKSAFVNLKVYDILGREIKTLENGYKQAGDYKVNFKAIDHPSGVYSYRLQAGDFVSIKRMMLVK